MAGAFHGYALLWALLVAIIFTIVLQEMAARWGVITGRGLAQGLIDRASSKTQRGFWIFLVAGAIFVGNAAYEAGNIGGGVLGLEALVPNSVVAVGGIKLNYWSWAIALIAALLLYRGRYKLIERSLIALVTLMSLCYLAATFAVSPDWKAVLAGLFSPSLTGSDALLIVALMGTTIVPYNLFLHASLVSKRWQGAAQLSKARKDVYVSIVLGGIISMSIVICAAASGATTIENAGDLAVSLEPLLGPWSNWFMGFGIMAAGVSSAITAPLAAALVMKELLGWKDDLRSRNFRASWAAVILVGLLLANLDIRTVELIKFAQFTNAVLLPIVAYFLIKSTNDASLMDDHKNSLFQKGLGWLAVALTGVLAIRGLEKVFEVNWIFG